MNDKIIISICGAAGSGKSNIAKKLVREIGDYMASRIPSDYYLKSYNNEPYEEYMNSPFKYDWEMIKKVILTPIGLQCESPDFDFNKLIRIAKTGGKPFTSRRYMIVDSILPYPSSNFVIKINAPSDLRLSRVKDRDKAQNMNSVRNWKKMEATANELESGKYKFDLLVSAFDDPEDCVRKIMEVIN